MHRSAAVRCAAAINFFLFVFFQFGQVENSSSVRYYLYKEAFLNYWGWPFHLFLTFPSAVLLLLPLQRCANR